MTYFENAEELFPEEYTPKRAIFEDQGFVVEDKPWVQGRVMSVNLGARKSVEHKPATLQTQTKRKEIFSKD